jgi:hypothetical protein
MPAAPAVPPEAPAVLPAAPAAPPSAPPEPAFPVICLRVELPPQPTTPLATADTMRTAKASFRIYEGSRFFRARSERRDVPPATSDFVAERQKFSADYATACCRPRISGRFNATFHVLLSSNLHGARDLQLERIE